jgi:hypothetical protein
MADLLKAELKTKKSVNKMMRRALAIFYDYIQ